MKKSCYSITHSEIRENKPLRIQKRGRWEVNKAKIKDFDCRYLIFLGVFILNKNYFETDKWMKCLGNLFWLFACLISHHQHYKPTEIPIIWVPLCVMLRVTLLCEVLIPSPHKTWLLEKTCSSSNEVNFYSPQPTVYFFTVYLNPTFT